MAAPGEGIRLGEGMYGYTIDDRSHASEIWRLTRREDDRLHMQAMLGSGTQALYGMDLLIGVNGAVEALDARVQERSGERHGQFSFSASAVRGQIAAQGHTQPVELALPPGTQLCPESIAMRFLIGQTLDLANEAEQTLPLCLITVRDDPQTSLVPRLVAARATVLGSEPVELLMATVQATRVLIEWPDHAPQHAWFDEHRFPVQWFWLGPGPSGPDASHECSLTRYAWHQQP